MAEKKELRILSSKESMDSAMKLRDALEKRLGLEPKTILVSRDSGSCKGKHVIMRYGCSYGTLEKEPEFGDKYFTSICISKQLTSNFLMGLVNTPLFMGKDWIPGTYPVMIRDMLNGTHGEGIHIVHNQEEFDKAWKDGCVWTEFFTSSMEIRVNVVFSATGFEARIYKKIPIGDGVNDAEFVCEYDNTKWSPRSIEYYPKVTSILSKVRQLLYKLGGRFVAFDMIYVPELKDYVVLEMNSGPWLSPTVADWLASILIREHQIPA